MKFKCELKKLNLNIPISIFQLIRSDKENSNPFSPRWNNSTEHLCTSEYTGSKRIIHIKTAGIKKGGGGLSWIGMTKRKISERINQRT